MKIDYKREGECYRGELEGQLIKHTRWYYGMNAANKRIEELMTKRKPPD